MNNGKQFDVNDLIEQDKSGGSITNSDIMQVLEDIDFDIEQMDKLYDSLENLTNLLRTTAETENSRMERRLRYPSLTQSLRLLKIPTTLRSFSLRRAGL